MVFTGFPGYQMPIPIYDATFYVDQEVHNFEGMSSFGASMGAYVKAERGGP